VKIETIFANWIAYENVSLNNDKITNYCYEIYNINSKGRGVPETAGWESSDIPILDVKDNDMKLLLNLITEKFNILSKNFQFNQIKEVYITNFWINIGNKNNFKRFHMHHNTVFVGVYYVQVPPNSGKIIFKSSDLDNYNKCVRDNMIENYNEYNSSTYSYQPKKGDLLFFPAWVEHAVENSQSDENRISITFNGNYRR